jgi:HTH-type transcriptional regulator, glycine betaine synthesis regulator
VHPVRRVELTETHIAHERANSLIDNGLSELEEEFIELFVRMAQLAGLPKSIGQIYGLIYLSSDPLNLEDVMHSLEISKGSASQGLKFLRSTGAVEIESVPNRRSDHYIAETSLRSLVSGFVKEQIEPHMENGIERLERLRQLAEFEDESRRELLNERIGRLERWHKRGSKMLPLVLRFLGR